VIWAMSLRSIAWSLAPPNSPSSGVSLNDDFRYLLSLDDSRERLIEAPHWGVLSEASAATGKVYLQAGALDAGETTGGKRPVRYIAADAALRAIYQNGRNHAARLSQEGHTLIYEGRKRRFVWVLAERGTLEFAAWRKALPAWVKEPEMGGETPVRVLVVPMPSSGVSQGEAGNGAGLLRMRAVMRLWLTKQLNRLLPKDPGWAGSSRGCFGGKYFASPPPYSAPRFYPHNPELLDLQ